MSEYAMTSQANLGEAVRDLQGQIDELATRTVLDGPNAELADGLIALGAMAQRGGCVETARIAADLAAGIRAAGDDELLAIESNLPNSMAQLQQALQDEAHKCVAPADGRASVTPQPPPSNSLAQDPELVGEFIVESREHLISIETQMLALEQNPANTEAIHSVFRGFHTIKGLAGFLELATIQEVAHDVETVLDLARNSKLAISSSVVDVVLEGADYLKQSIDAVEAEVAGRTCQPVLRNPNLLARIKQLTTGDVPPPPEQAPALADLAQSLAALETAPVADAVAIPGTAEAVSSPPEAAAKEQPGKGGDGKAADTSSVRVETRKLDYLLETVGELVIAQSLIRHNPALAALQDPKLLGGLSQLARITSEVQRTTMGMRMVPIGQVFQRTARLVRDLSRKAGKQVELETSGEDTELDKTIAEELSDPFMHMVRNAIDHGIETAEEREAAGKSPTARVRLAAYHQGGQIVVEISDDGRGLDRAKILKKALQQGLVEDGAQLSDTEVFHLIFMPGFSTAAVVTEISGRGVGMDVVMKHVQKLRGRIETQSKPGAGTTFFLKLPLTLAIIEGLVVVVGSQRYIVPIFAVREMFRPTPDVLSTVQGRDEMALVRGRLLPVVRLCRRFGVQPRSEDPCDGLLVVAECEGKQFCLLVDDLAGKQEVVIKNLGDSLKKVPGVAGGAILGDGRVGLILDMDSVFRGGNR